MKLALAQYTSIEIEKEVEFITSYSDSFETFFEKRNYGDDIKEITINIICVSEKFEPFFKPKRPKYIKDKKIIISSVTKLTHEIEKSLEYDLKIDFNEFKKADDETERKKILSCEILSSLDSDILAPIKKKIKDFDWEAFKKDLETYFKEKDLL